MHNTFVISGVPLLNSQVHWFPVVNMSTTSRHIYNRKPMYLRVQQRLLHDYCDTYMEIMIIPPAGTSCRLTTEESLCCVELMLSVAKSRTFREICLNQH